MNKFKRTKTGLHIVVMAAMVFYLTAGAFIFVPPANANGNGYNFWLSSPTPPDQSDTFTWTLYGVKPEAGQEISHFSLEGCWRESDIKSVSVVTDDNSAVSWSWDFINPPGGSKSLKFDINNDNQLTALITVVFKQFFPSNGWVDGWIKQGNEGLVPYPAYGPN